MSSMIRTIIIVIYIALFLILFLPVLGLLFIAKKLNILNAGKLMQSILRIVCKGIVFLVGMDLNVIGKDNVPKDTPVLFVGNHLSYFDIIATLSQNTGRFAYIAKLELGKIPSLKQWMLGFDCIFLDRDDIKAGLQAILNAVDNVNHGISMFIYPEGTRYHDGIVHEFKAGSFKIASKAKCPIVPVTIKGSDDLFEKHVPNCHPAKVTLNYGKPIYPKDIPEEYKKKVGEYVHKIISETYSKLP